MNDTIETGGKFTTETDKLDAAMAKAQGEFESVSKDAVNPHFRSKYASLSSIVNAIRPSLARHGLWFHQHIETQDGLVRVRTILSHSSGQKVDFGWMSLPVSKQDAQGYGSAITYARRYALCSCLGIVADDDDDGNSAVGNPAPRSKPVVGKPVDADELVRQEIIRLIRDGDPQANIPETVASICADLGMPIKGGQQASSDQLRAVVNYLRGDGVTDAEIDEAIDEPMDDARPTTKRGEK